MRRLLLAMAATTTVGLLALIAVRGVQLPMFDFVEYWAAGRLCADGENPYDLDAVGRIERDLGRTEEPVLMWNPPWTLPLVIPFGLLEPRLAHVLWLLIQFAALAYSADRLWIIYGGDPEKRWFGWLTALTFAPCHFALTAGQISPLMLLGAVLFLDADRAGRPVLAGLAAVLLAVKPHLVLLFFVAILLCSPRERRWRTIVGGSCGGIVLVAITLVFRPSVLADYWETMTQRPPSQYDSPTLGMLLRAIFGGSFGIQFVPIVFGLAWMGVYRRRHSESWSWLERMPPVLLVSMLCAAYGAWPFDLVLLLVPAMQLTSRHGFKAFLVHLAVNVPALGLMFLPRAEFFWFVWLTPAMLAVWSAFPSTTSEARNGVQMQDFSAS